MSKKLPDGYKLQQSYPVTCSVCGHEQMVRPSALMRFFDFNSGHGKCMECGTFLHLEIDTKKQVMTSQDWDEWLAEETAANEETTREYQYTFEAGRQHKQVVEETAVRVRCPACGDDRTGKGSLIYKGMVFCNDPCFIRWQRGVIEEAS